MMIAPLRLSRDDFHRPTPLLAKLLDDFIPGRSMLLRGPSILPGVVGVKETEAGGARLVESFFL
jgi:hypothetical protein